jgi:hypothetical protein
MTSDTQPPTTDAIASLLVDVQKRLAAIQAQESQTVSALDLALNKVLIAKKQSLLQGQRRDIQVGGETVLNALRNGAITAVMLTESISILCTIVGSIMVQVEPGKVETINGRPVPIRCGEMAVAGNDDDGGDG